MGRKLISRRHNSKQRFATLPDWLSPAQVALYLGLGRDATYDLFHKLKARRFGNLLRLPKYLLDPNTRRSR